MSDIVVKADDYINPVRDRIRDTFASMIPDEQWEKLCRAEMEAFFRDVRDFHGNNPSPFAKIVREVLQEKAKAYIKAFMDDPKYSITSVYNYNETTGNSDQQVMLSQHLDEVITKALPDMITAMFKQMISGGVHQMFAQMRASGQF